MAKLNVVQISSKAFTHSSVGKFLTTEISDLRIRGFDRLYDDACDEGLVLVNEKTGNKTTWSLQQPIFCEDELSAWLLKPTAESLYKNPALAGYSMTIFND